MSVVALARVIRDALKEDLASTEAGILGGVQTWDEYQRLCGKRQGLQRAALILEDEFERMEKQE